MSRDCDDNKYPGFGQRVNFVALLMFIAFGVLVLRLWELQVVRSLEYQGKADNNRLREQRLEAARGLIYGRGPNGEDVVLADNRPARDLMFVPAHCDDPYEEVCARLEELLGIDAAEMLARIEKTVKAGRPHEQIPIQRDVPHGIAARVEEYGFALPGVIMTVRPIRRYVYGETGGMLLGYLGEVGERELQREDSPYHIGDLLGRTGLELVYEGRLRGRDGEMLLTQFAMGSPQLRTDPYGKPYFHNLVDNYGHGLKVESSIYEPEQGESLYTTLDIQLQEKAEGLLAGEQGAIAVINADTGQVYALASRPNYDPSIFVNQHASERRAATLNSKPNRMINRNFQEMYAPGSTFKILLAAAALEEGIITKHTTHTCNGAFRLKPNSRPWHCWWRRGHGTVNVEEAIATSCDVFFYNVGQDLGVDRINEWCDRIGFGQKSGLDLPGEVVGLVPDRDWKRKLMEKQVPDQPWDHQWFDGDTVNLSIGQGAMAATPLQVCVLMASVLNDGRRVQPYLLRENRPPASERYLSDATIQIVRNGMQQCVEKRKPVPTGTGKAARIEGMTVIGKTGSAQTVSLAKHEKYATEEDIPKEIRDHAWFMAGVLDREPRIAVCVLVEHGHHGSSAAAPLAKEVIEFFYEHCVPTPESERLAAAEGTR